MNRLMRETEWRSDERYLIENRRLINHSKGISTTSRLVLRIHYAQSVGQAEELSHLTSLGSLLGTFGVPTQPQHDTETKQNSLRKFPKHLIRLGGVPESILEKHRINNTTSIKCHAHEKHGIAKQKKKSHPVFSSGIDHSEHMSNALSGVVF